MQVDGFPVATGANKSRRPGTINHFHSDQAIDKSPMDGLRQRSLSGPCEHCDRHPDGWIHTDIHIKYVRTDVHRHISFIHSLMQ